jgi:hypothetical protein
MKQYDEKDIEEILQNHSIELFDALTYHNKDMYIPIIEKNCKKDKYDYFNLAHQALESNVNSWNLGNILIDFIPYSKVDIDNILKCYKKLHSKENGTSIHFQITKTLVLNNHKLAKELLEKLVTIDDDFIIPHVSAILVELHNSNHESQHNTIINYLKNNNSIQLQCAISYIQQFNFSDEELKKVFELFKEKVNISNKEIDRELLYSSYDLIEKGYEYFSEILLLYIDNDDFEIKSNLFQILMYACKNHIDKKWFRKLFNSIINIDINNQNIFFNIESVLNNFLKIDDYDFIKEFLYKWIEKGNLSSTSSKNILSSFRHEFNKHKFFSKFVTESLVYENNKLHKVLVDLIDSDVTLDISVLKSFTFQDYLYVCRKILGYFYEFNTINTMIFSILSVDNLSIETKQLVTDILLNYLGKNYSYDTLEYYKQLDDIKLNNNEKEVKDKVVNVLEKRNQQIKELPILKELTPSSQQNRIISRTQSIAMNKAMKKSRKEDSFMSLFFGNEIFIKYGKGSFSEINGAFRDVMYLQSYSHSITMPNATITHPIDYELERFSFRMVKKGQ